MMRVGVLVSGAGTNLQALIDAQARGLLAPAELACVISNVPDVPALERAAKAGLAHHVVSHRDIKREDFERSLIAVLEAAGVELVVLAGFMRILTARFTDRFSDRIINTHPSLLPSFPGAEAARQAIGHGVKVSGVTVHFVDTSLDGGPIIAQVAVPVRDDDTPATLQARIQTEEHVLLPAVVRSVAAGELTCEGRRVTRVARAH